MHAPLSSYPLQRPPRAEQALTAQGCISYCCERGVAWVYQTHALEVLQKIVTKAAALPHRSEEEFVHAHRT